MMIHARGVFTRLTGAVVVCGMMAGVLVAGEAPKIPPAEEVVLPTADGLQLAATYYPGTAGKESVPVVLLHMWKGSRAEYRNLAVYLQRLGHAVLVPDLRGHGDSLNKLDAAKLGATDFDRMIRFDMSAVKDFLWTKNNEGTLNLNRLCVVGAEMGASVAVGFTAFDWLPRGGDFPYYGALQQGRFVKGVVLLSPEGSYKGMNMPRLLQSMGELNRALSYFILVGGETSSLNTDAKRLRGILERWHPEPEGENKSEKKTLFLGSLPTTLQGTKMLGASDLKVELHIATFIDLRLVKSDAARAITWKTLRRPHE